VFQVKDGKNRTVITGISEWTFEIENNVCQGFGQF
jgi:hypothetical protein